MAACSRNFYRLVAPLALLALCILLSVGPAAPAAAQNGVSYYVAPTGDDENDGRSLTRAFRTIQRCANIASAGDTCWIRAGVYRETITPAHSGVAGRPITFAAYAGETVTISGADPIDGWTRYSGEIYRAPMPWTARERRSLPEPFAADNQVFIGGIMLPEARWPNIPWEKTTSLISADNAQADAAQVFDHYNAAYFDSDLSAVPAARFNGGKINFAPGIHLAHTTCDVTHQTSAAVTFRCIPDPAARDGSGREIANDLDPPGDLYDPQATNYYFLWGVLAALDAPGEWFYQDGMLYLWAPGGGLPAGVEARRRPWAFDLADRQQIILDGLSFFAATVRFNAGVQSTVVQNAVFRYPWHTQQLPPLFWANGTHGIQMMGASNVVRDSDLFAAPGCAIMLGGRSNRAANNVIREAGYMGFSSAIAGQLPPDFNPGGALKNAAIHNTVFDLGRIAVFADAGLDIQHNDLYGAERQSSGLGIIFAAGMDGKNAEIAYNLIHDNVAEATARYYGGHGIFMDDNTYNYRIYRNIIWNTTGPALFLFGGNGGLATPAPPATSTNRQVYNNTLVDSRLQAEAKRDISPPQTLAGTEFRNNVAYIVDLDSPYVSNADHNYQGDPVFMDAPQRDYRLRPGSPAVNAGVNLGSPYMDGPMAPIGAPDLGALESGRPALAFGATLRSSDLAGLSVSCYQTDATTARCQIVNMPIGRALPDSFQVRVGNSGAAAGGCLTHMDYATHLGTGMCAGIPVGGLTGEQTVFARIGDGAWQPVADLSLAPAIALASVHPSAGDTAGGTRLTIAGRRFAEGLAGYRRSVTLNNQSGGPLHNYPILITLNTAGLIAGGKLRSDCGDLRFSDAEGLLAYWIEDGTCNSAETRVWVKIPTMPAGVSAISLTYGNSDLRGMSDGRATFHFFDDFEDGIVDASKWDLRPGSNAAIAKTGGQMRLTGPLRPAQPLDTAYFMLQFLNDTMRFPPIFALDADLSVLQGGRGFTASAGSCPEMMQLRNAPAHLPASTDIGYVSGGNAITLGKSSVSEATFAGLRVSVGYAGLDAARDVYWVENGNLAQPRAVRRSAGSACRGLFGYRPAVATPFDVRFDNIRLRSFAFPEPTVTLGAETSAGVRVLLGGQPCRNVSVENPTRLTCLTPPHAAGIVDVIATNPDGASAARTGAFRYVAGGMVTKATYLPLIKKLTP